MFHHHDRERKLRTLLRAALLVLVSAIPASQSPESAVTTKAGEWHTHTFEDGSIATLGPRTVITYTFSHDRRSIHLIGGEALFQVKKDPQRPFVVATAVGCARALGTIFSVSHQLRTTAVITQEGIVGTARLDRDDPDCSDRGIRLLANEKAVIASRTPLVARAVDTAVEHAWTHREIIFTGQTVALAVAEFNRRNWIQLDLADDAEIRQMRLFGRFPLDDPERFAHYLAAVSRPK